MLKRKNMQQSSLFLKEQINRPDIRTLYDNIQELRKSTDEIKKHRIGLRNQDVLNIVTRMEKSLDDVFKLLTLQKNQEVSQPIQKNHFTMKKYWLNDILKRSIPKQIPKGVKIDLPANEVEVYGHMYKLIVLFSNLIENSIDAMNQNGKIKINAIQVSDRLKIEVLDSGPGIPTNIMESMFTSLKTTKQGGTGLGTRMAKTIIDLHGGRISVRNNPTTFTIELPLERRYQYQ